jgi:hypothetical protein
MWLLAEKQLTGTAIANGEHSLHSDRVVDFDCASLFNDVSARTGQSAYRALAAA